MKNFVETSFMFDPKLGIEEPLRAKILTVTKRQLLIHKDKFLNILTADFEPETRKAELEMLIADNRPDLEGCRVFSFVYELCKNQWQIGVIHGRNQTGKATERGVSHFATEIKSPFDCHYLN